MQQCLLVHICGPNWTWQQQQSQQHQQVQIPNPYWTREQRENQQHQRVQISNFLSLQAITMAGGAINSSV